MRRAVLPIAVVALLTAPASANHSNTELVSTGPTGGNGAFPAQFQTNSADGQRLLFRTSEQLVAADTDAYADVYERAGTTTNLISTGSSGGNGPHDASAASISEDGTHAFFETDESLVPEDTDSSVDVYERVGGTTSLASPETLSAATYAGSSADGSHVIFHSGGGIYDRFAGTTTQIATSGTVRAVSPDGNRIVFQVHRNLYAYSGGTLAADVTFGGASRDATVVAFTSMHAHTSDEPENDCWSWNYGGWPPTPCADVFVNAGGVTSRASTSDTGRRYPAEFAGISKDGAHVFFTTEESASSDDRDFCYYDDFLEENLGCNDLFDYMVSSGVTRVASWNTGGAYSDCSWPFDCDDIQFGGSSADGTRVFFNTPGTLAPDDTPADCDYSIGMACWDVYENSAAGGSVLVSKHTSPASIDSFYLGNSDDGERVFYRTTRRDAPNDTDNSEDIYERYRGATTLISTGPAGGNGNFIPTYKGASADGTAILFETAEPLALADSDTSVDVYAARALPGYPRPRGATPIYVPLVPAAQACTTPNNTHGPPLSQGSCTPALAQSSTTFTGIGDGDPATARSTGFVKLKARPGTAGPPDDADVQIDMRLTHVMNRPDRTDYTGELRLELPLRLTDRYNGAPDDSGTMTDASIFATAGCTPTDDPGMGSTCTLATTADALTPNTVLEGWKAVWGLGQVKVRDGGPDRDADTSGDNELLAVQGVFVP